MVDAAALWLVPGLDHPVYARFSDFFRTLFRRFEALDYRAMYLERGQSALEAQIIEALQRSGARMLVYSQFPSSYAYLRPEFLSSVRERCLVVGLGYDDEIYFEQAKFFYQSCSAVITTDIAGAEWLKQAGIPAYLAQLQLPQSFRDVPAPPEDIDVSFVGDMSKPGRRDYVQYLESRGIAVADFGAGSRRGRIADAEVLDVFRRSKINLNFTGTNPPRWILRHDPFRNHFGQIKGRPFELAAMGRFCLCEWTPCVEYWFRPGIDIGVFRDPPDLERQVRHYLSDDASRRATAAAAKERHRTELASELQFTRIFSAIVRGAEQVKRRRLVPGNAVFYESMGRSRGVAFLHALHRKSPLRALGEVFNAFVTRLAFWRGFAGGVLETVATRMRRA